MSDQNTPPEAVPLAADLGRAASHVTDAIRDRAIAAARAARESGAVVPKLLASDRSDEEPIVNGRSPAPQGINDPRQGAPAARVDNPEQEPALPGEVPEHQEPALPDAPPTEFEIKIARREREQRIREQEARRFETQNRQQSQQMQEMQQKLARAERALKAMDLAQTDPVAAAREIGIDEKAFIMRRAEMGTDKERVSDIERQQQTDRQALEQLRQEIQQERDQLTRERAHSAFVAKATKDKFPTVSAVYDGDPNGLVARGYEVQAMFVQQMGRPPTDAEVLHNLERLEKQRVDRYRKIASPSAPAQVAKPALAAPAQPKLTPSAGGEGSGRNENPALDEETRRANALKAAKEIARQAKQQR